MFWPSIQSFPVFSCPICCSLDILPLRFIYKRIKVCKRQHFHFYYRLSLPSPSQSHMTFSNTSTGPLLPPPPALPRFPSPNRLQHCRFHLLSLAIGSSAVSRKHRLYQHWRHGSHALCQKAQLRQRNHGLLLQH